MAAANVGIALLPGAVGVLARRQGLEIVCVFLLVASVLLFVLEEAVALAAKRQTAVPS